MNNDTNFAAYAFACFIVLSLLALVFSGSPDYMDAVICDRLKATPKQCAAFIDTSSEQVVSVTTKKDAVE